MTRQEAENLQDGLQKMAVTVWIFYDALIRAGFDDGHAMYLTNEFMKGITESIGKAAVKEAVK